MDYLPSKSQAVPENIMANQSQEADNEFVENTLACFSTDPAGDLCRVRNFYQVFEV